MLNYEPVVSPGVPAPLAALLLALLAVDPESRPTAEAARRWLASLAAESVLWAPGPPPAREAMAGAGGAAPRRPRSTSVAF